MPQMMPLSWLILFIMFSTALLLFTTTNFYLLIPKSEVHKSKIKVNPTTWKW
nr:ATP synthase F0 subunit 8 [Calcaritermes temnocephalus]